MESVGSSGSHIRDIPLEGTTIYTSAPVSADTWEKALAVLPAEARTSERPEPLAFWMVGKASSSLKLQVFINAPLSGQYPLNEMYRLFNPSSAASSVLLYVTGPESVVMISFTGSQSWNRPMPGTS